MLCLCYWASLSPPLCSLSRRHFYRCGPIWTWLLPCIFWNWDHKFQSGSCSPENERGQENTSDRGSPITLWNRAKETTKPLGERLKIQQFLWAWGPTFNLIPTQVEVIYVSLFLTACRQVISNVHRRHGEIGIETKQASEREETSRVVPTHGRYLQSKWLCLMPSTSSAWMKW